MDRRGSEQALVALLALALWALWPQPALYAVLAAYALAWLGLSLTKAWRPALLAAHLTRAQALAVLALVALPALAQGARRFDELVEHEALSSADRVLGARLRVEATPSIAPPLVAADRPQTFYVHAPAASEVAVRFGRGATRLSAVGLGHGLFRVEYDPRAHGPPAPPDGELRAVLEVDGAATERAMLAVRPLPHPRWLAPSPDRRRAVAVSEETDELFVVDASGLTHRVEVDDGPSDARFVDDERVLVAHRYTGSLAEVDLAGGEIVRRIEVGPLAHHLAIGAEIIAVARRETIELLDASGAAVGRVEPGFAPDHVVFAGGALIVSSVRPPALHRFVAGPSGWREDRPPLWLGRPAVTMTASGDRVIVAVTDLSGEGPPHLGNHFVEDQLVTIDARGWRVTEARLTARRTSRQERPGDVDRGVSPMGIDVEPDGSLRVAFAGTDDVWRFGPEGVEPEVLWLDEHPLAAPFSAVALAGGRVVVSSPSYGAIGVFTRAGGRERLVRLAPDDRALLRGDERALQRRIGERSFYESTRSGVSCQSCHLHGGSDGSAHNIGGLTLVATLDARGAMGTPPYLRDGGYPTLGSLDELARTVYRGFLRHQGGRRLGLERYLEAQPRPIPPRQLEGRDLARERRGLDVYVRARCPLCHGFPAFTNLGQHPMEALFPALSGTAGHELDTPSLLGLQESAPYLVDGRAETLAAVFREHDPARRHGDTRGLSDGELADLVHFLEGL